ncbi:ABC transporter permease [Tellurirhabdus rosea]|uniref:ABC transporter permease n=1 Tax=Tellurirhabdus rosea TaxID=2674997 RepID=UPI0022508BCF|nr:ABC transporter permease [Tellurirhabdus rosea]
MFKNYLKIAFRSLWKNKTQSLINIVGLSVAFGTCLLLFLAAAFQLSFDSFHKDSGRIYRTYFLSLYPDGSPDPNPTMPFPLVPALKAEYPEVEKATRIIWGGGGVRYGDKVFNKQVRACDADFLEIFTFPLLKGETQTALADLSSIVISENMAKDVFGAGINPVGKSLQVKTGRDWRNFVVSAVISDAPGNSTIEYDAFIRIENVPDYSANKDRWDNQTHEVYVKLAANAQQMATQKRFSGLMQKYMKDVIDYQIRQGRGKNEMGEYYSLMLQPLNEVHFDDISREAIYTIIAIGIFILVIACINFINLTIARALTRAREVGVRKSLGAKRWQLFTQIWGETVLICLVALGLGVLLANVVMPQFNQLFNARLSLMQLLTPMAAGLTVAGFLLVTFVAGGYPSWIISRFNTVQVLKGRITMKRPGMLRNSLIVTQFSIACLLIGCTLVMLQQINYLRERPLGLTQEQVISVPVGGELDGKVALQRLRQRLGSESRVVAVTGTNVNIGYGLDGSSSRSRMGFQYNKKDVTTDWLRVDFDYLKTLNIKLLQGRDFSPEYSQDSVSSVMITEKFARQLGEKTPVGKFLQPDSAGQKYQIVGVVSDFNLYSLREDVSAITLQMSQTYPINYIFVRVQPQNVAGSMDMVKAAWKEIAPQTEFKGSFMDENTDRWYRKEQKLSTILTAAAIITVVLSCMGLFAVALMTIEQRTKEIGIRKVLGASVGGLVALLSKDFLKLVFLAILIATPLAWYAMQKWLQDFAYRIPTPWAVFALAGLVAVLIAFLTVSYHSIRAALMNPVKSLKTE